MQLKEEVSTSPVFESFHNDQLSHSSEQNLPTFNPDNSVSSEKPAEAVDTDFIVNAEDKVEYKEKEDDIKATLSDDSFSSSNDQKSDLPQVDIKNGFNKDDIGQKNSNRIIIHLNDTDSDENDLAHDERPESEPEVGVEESPHLNRLLSQLHLTKEDLAHTGISFDTLEFVLNPGVYGRIIHFIMTTPILLSLLRWPLLQRSGVSVPQKELPKQRESRLIAATEEDISDIDTMSFKKNSFLSESFENSHSRQNSIQDTLFLNENAPLVRFLPQEKQKDKSIIFTTHGLLLGTEARLKAVLSLNAFYSSFETVFDGIWSALVASLIIQGTANYYLYPDERDGTRLLDVIGIGGLLDIFCIRSIDFFKNHFCFDAKNHYVESLASAFNEYYIWLFIVCIPFIFASIDAGLSIRQTKALNHGDIEKLAIILKNHKPGIWNDTLGWLLSVAVPDILAAIIPPTILLRLLPQPEVKIVLEKICSRIIWDGRLTDEQRKDLFDELLKFSGQHTQLTQMKALSMLATVIENIYLDDLVILKEEGRDEDTLKTLLYIKTKAFDQLHYFATADHSDEMSNNSTKNIPRFIFVHYLLWGLGYPESLVLQPLFFAYKGLKLFFKLMFYTAIAKGIIDIINRYNDEQACIKDQKVWSWIPVWQNYTCSYCGDLPIQLLSIFSPESCVGEYLREPRTLNQILNVFARFNSSQLKDIGIGLTLQHKIIKEKQLPVLLKNLKGKLLKIVSFGLNQNYLSFADMEAILDFLNASFIVYAYPGFELSLTDATFERGGISLLSRFLRNNKNIVTILLSNSNLTAEDAIILGAGLKQSRASTLLLNGNPLGDKGIKAIAENLPSGREINNLRLDLDNCNITSVGCIALGEAFFRLNAQSVFLSLQNNSIDSDCAIAIAKELPRLASFQLGEGAYIDDDGIYALAHAFQKGNSPIGFFSLIGYNASTEAISALLAALPKARNLLSFHYIDNRFEDNFNYSAVIPGLCDALNTFTFPQFDFAWEGRNGFGWGNREAELFASFMEQDRLHSLASLSLSNNKIGPSGMQAIARALPKTNLNNIGSLNFNNNSIGVGIVALGEYLRRQNSFNMLNFDNNNITTSDMNSLFDLFNKNLLVFFVSFSKNAIGNDPALKWLNIKLLNAGNLDLSDARIDTEGAILLANALIKRKHGLWINSINHRRSLLQSQPATNIITLDLSHNLLGDKGVQALCDILPYTRMGRNDIILDNTGITDPKILENCGLLSSDANSLRYELFYPYFLLYSKYRAFQKLFYSALAQFYNSKITLHTEQMAGEHDYSTKQSAHTVDAFSYKASNAVVIDAGSYPDNIVAVRGSVYKNNLLMGGKKTLLDVSESRGSNFLKSENNTKMRLGFFSKDHVVVAEGQGTIQINGFNSNDTLHLIAEHTVYDVEAHLTICQNTILKNGIPSATIQIKETMVQLWNTRCEDIENNIHINDPEAIDRAKWEVMNPPENNQSILYSSLLGMCETFVNSASKSALFTAVPSFVTETLYWTGGYTRNESEKLGQEIQMLLLLSFTESPEIIAASSLASLLASRLTNSQNIISAVGMGVSIASAVAGSLSSVNATLGWMAIQTSTALVGSVVGSWGIYKLPEIGRWGLNKASDTKNYLKNKLSFWSDKTIDSIEVLEVAQNLNMTQMGSK